MSNRVEVNSSSGLQSWSVDFTPLNCGEYKQRASQLEDRLLSRLSLSILSQRGIVDDSDLAKSLHSAASNLNRKLAHRSSLMDLQSKNILPLGADDDANGQHLDGRYHQRKQSLQDLMAQRPDISEIADLGYIDDSGMAPALQPTALRLNRRLTERKSRDDLLLKGIILPEDETAIGDNDEYEERKKAKSRKSRSQKHEKNPSIIWKDVKRRKSKKGASSGSNHDGTVSSDGQYRVGDRVKLTKGRSGTIRHVLSCTISHFIFFFATGSAATKMTRPQTNIY